MNFKDRTTSLINPSRSSLQWDRVGFSVGSKVILSDCSGLVYAGQMVGIFGASGCGKSTLLNCLSGRLGKGNLTGQVLYNGSPRFKRHWKSACAFIEQDEVMYRHLTVRETLMYAAELKLPTSMKKSEKKKKVDTIIQQLGLNACQNTKIGDPDNKGISGGERKRVAIGIEIISDPSVVLLDEPTSGLDSFTALNLVRTLRDIGIENRRITLMTVHQPRNELLDLFDFIIVLGAGGMIFSGPVEDALDHFTSMGFSLPPLTNPADFFLDITSINYESKETEKESRERIATFKKTWSVVQKPLPPPQVHFAEKTLHIRSWWTAFFVLFRRNFIDMVRNRTVIYATILQTAVVMAIIGFVFKDVPSDIIKGVQNRFGCFVFLGLYNAFMNVIPTVLIFPQHRQVIRRERAAGTYSASAAYMAKLVSLIPLCWISSVILSAPLPYFLGLQARSNFDYVLFIICILIQSQAASSFGLMVGAGVVNGTTGLLVSFPVVIVMLLFGGLLVNLSTLHPAVFWLQFVSIIANCTKALAQLEVPGLKLQFSLGTGAPMVIPKEILDILQTFGLDSVGIYGLMAINLSLAILFSIIGYILFRYTAAPSYNLGKSSENAKNGKYAQGLQSISTPNAVEMPLKDLQPGRESVVSFSPFSGPKPPPYLDDQDSISSNGSPSDIFAKHSYTDEKDKSSGAKRRPRSQSKVESQDPTEIYTRRDTIEKNYNSITFSDLDDYIGMNHRE